VQKGVISERAIRLDRHTCFTIVASYPVATDAVEDSPDELLRFRKWGDLTLAWVRDQYGDQLKAAFVHLDERYPHLHLWLLPDNSDADATVLHPGKNAKRDTEARLKSGGVPPREAVAAGNRALKSAMRTWIDDYHRQVGAPLGMHRDGPKRRRLSRAQWRAERAMLDHHRQLNEDRVRLQDQVSLLEARAVKLALQQHEMETKAKAFVDRAEQHHLRMRAEAAQIAALGPLLTALVTEIENRTISCTQAGGWRVRDPSPFRAAGNVWARLEPTIRRLVRMIRDAEEGRWTAEAHEPKHCALPHDDLGEKPFEGAL